MDLIFCSKYCGIPSIIYSYLENNDLLKIAEILHDLGLPLSQIKIDMWICDTEYGEQLVELFKHEKKDCLKLRMKPLYREQNYDIIVPHLVEIVNDNMITDIACEKFINLTSLNPCIDHTIGDKELKYFKNLKFLNLSYNKNITIDILKELNHLVSLDLEDNRIITSFDLLKHTNITSL